MFKEEMAEYKQLYTQLIECMVELHNRHQIFIVRPSAINGRAVKSQARRMVKIQKALCLRTLPVARTKLAESRERNKEINARRAAIKQHKKIKEEQYGIDISKRPKKTI